MRPASPGLEERFGARLFTWIGSIALFLAGAYLVKYTFDRGLLGPGARVVLGILFGVVLLVLGEWLRRRSALVATGLSAAGLADLYASLYAGTSLYALIPAPVGFGLMALVTATAVLLSLRQGLIVAIIALVGGFLTPALVGAREPNTAALFAYLFLLQAGLVAAARPRRWWGIAIASVGGGALWVSLWLARHFRPGDELALGIYLLASVALFFTAALLGAGEREPRARDALAIAAAVSAMLLLAALVVVGDYGAMEWLFLGLLAAGCLAVARFRPAYSPLGWMASAAGIALLMRWYGASDPPAILPWAALGYGGLIVLGAWLAMRGDPRPDQWAALASLSAVFYFLASWAVLRLPEGAEPLARAALPAWRDIPWGVVSILLGALLVGLALPLFRSRDGNPVREAALGALAAGATFFAGAALPFEIGRFSLTVAWALEAAALAFLAGRLRMPVLRPLSLLLAAFVLFRLLFNPWLFGYDVGGTPVVNWLLFGYGVPLAAFAVASWLHRRQGAHAEATAFEWGAVALGLALAALEVRHYFHWSPVLPHDTFGEFGKLLFDSRPPFYLLEAGAIPAIWLGAGLALLAAWRRAGRESLQHAARATLALGLGAGLFLLGLAANPLLEPVDAGSAPVFNPLLLAYGVPALLAALAARALAPIDAVGSRAAAVVSLLGAWALITLEVRQAFHGARLDAGEAGNAELYAYSAAWILFGVALLASGVVSRSLTLRWASLVVMLAAVLKVFLWDLSELKDLYRVFSLLGLGASLLLLAFVYQRFVFRRVGGGAPGGAG